MRSVVALAKSGHNIGDVKTITSNRAKREQLTEAATPSDPATLPRLVRASVIAEALDVSARCVTLWAQNGKIPSVRVGATVRFDPAAVLASLDRKGEA